MLISRLSFFSRDLERRLQSTCAYSSRYVQQPLLYSGFSTLDKAVFVIYKDDITTCDFARFFAQLKYMIITKVGEVFFAQIRNVNYLLIYFTTLNMLTFKCTKTETWFLFDLLNNIYTQVIETETAFLLYQEKT